MKRPLKFRAYIKPLQITVYDIAVYNDGDILAGGSEFDDRLKDKNADYHIDWDAVWERDRETGEEAVQRYDKDKNDYEEVLYFIPVDGSLLIDADQCIISQYTGLNDSDGREIYEDDILSVNTPPYSYMNMIESRTIRLSLISFKNYQFVQLLYKGDEVFMIDSLSSLEDLDQKKQPKTYKIIGNIYQHKHLLTEIK